MNYLFNQVAAIRAWLENIDARTQALEERLDEYRKQNIHNEDEFRRRIHDVEVQTSPIKTTNFKYAPKTFESFKYTHTFGRSLPEDLLAEFLNLKWEDWNNDRDVRKHLEGYNLIIKSKNIQGHYEYLILSSYDGGDIFNAVSYSHIKIHP